MPTRSCNRGFFCYFLGTLGAFGLFAAQAVTAPADPPSPGGTKTGVQIAVEQTKGSEIAAADDLVAAVDAVMKLLDETLTDPADYEIASQERVNKSGILLAMLAMTLGNHDQPNAVQPGAAELYKSALAISKNSKDFAAAKNAFTVAQSARKTPGGGAVTAPKWEVVRGLGAIMKKVGEFDAAIKRGLTPERFEKNKAQLQWQSAALAAIAQVTMLDTHEVKKTELMPQWESDAVAFRQAASALNRAVAAGDREAAAAAYANVGQACHQCHKTFHPPKP